MKRNLILASFIVLLGCNNASKKESQETSDLEALSFNVNVANPTAADRTGVLVMVKESELPSDFNHQAFTVMDGETEIPSQYNEKGEKGLAFVIDELAASAKKEYTVEYDKEGARTHNYTKRTQAELSIKEGGEWKGKEYIGGTFKNVDSLRKPDEHTDHSWYIRYEGPGWESDLVGYRFYLDWRNATDVYGKTGRDMELQHVGQDGFDSYHNFNDWGMDVLKVGKSLGVGSIATFQEGKAMRVAETDSIISKISENGDVYSEIQTDYYGWKVAGKDLDLKSVISIHAGTRLSKEHLELEKELENIATGLHKDENAKLFSSEGDANSWGYLATYGAQSLNQDNLGIAVLFSNSDFMSFEEDEFSHIVTLKPTGKKVDYYFLAAWEKENGGITTEEEFLQYLKDTAAELAKPVQVSITQ
ncbi:DUF4861 domain-containing protein [Fulvivirga sediminis]|uniref:DUF4861 domain-containing protein n=1 Tax=Fulvivirga sediminis TaxID=2803949 RepID=A0A937K0A4_9BACT|nr:DUF4861 domain-containing protein [Fulvivirga sediminis]MBL3656110.1 DUF4861 domain-containing protein [Fulvivirga sediminis]